MLQKPVKSRRDVAKLVIDAIEAAFPDARLMPPFIEPHIRDGLGRTWDVIVPAPTVAHRQVIDSGRDQFDLDE